MTVEPTPLAAISNNNQTLCSGSALAGMVVTNPHTHAGAPSFDLAIAATTGSLSDLTSTGNALNPVTGENYPYTINGTLTNNSANTITIEYRITPRLAGCASGAQTIARVTIHPEPLLSTTLTPPDNCSNSSFSYTAASATPGTTFSWERLAVPGISPAANSGTDATINEILRNITGAPIAVTYEFTLTANGCSNTQNVVVNIKPEPVITPGQATDICSGNPLDYSIALDNFTNPGAGVTFTWNTPVLNPADPAFTGGNPRNTASSANITDTFVNTLGIIGTATYTVTPYYNGCAGQPVDIVIRVGSEPVLDPGLDDFACSNDAIGLVLREAAGSVAPSHYNIISVNMETGLSAASTNAIVPNDNAPATYLSGDIFENKTGVDKTVTYRVQPVLAPDCFGDPVDVVMTIRPQPVIVPGQTSIVCSGEPIDMEILLIPANTPAGVRFNWSAPAISDGSVQGSAGSGVEADPAGTVHINDVIRNYSSAAITATYRVTPVSAEGCRGEEVAVIITINPEPLPKPISGRADLCAGESAPVVYNVTPVGGSSFHWTVDPAVGTKTFDFNTNAIMITAATAAGTGNISVYETNSLGCPGAPFTLPVRVWDSPDPENITGEQTVCAYSTHTYSVTHRPGSVYSWTLPGGAALVGNPSGNSIQVVFGNVGGTILVRETNIAGCITDHDPLAVTVNPQPTANITNGGTMCDGGTRALTVSFIGTAPFSFTYAINGTPQAPISTSDNPYILNATLAGTYSVVNVTDNTGCTGPGSGTATITYFPKPTGIISGTAELCRGSQATITMTFTGVPPYTFTYTDGTTPVTVTNHPNSVYTANVSPSVSSTYTLVSLSDGNNCDGVLSGQATINVNQPPSLTLTGTDLICHNVPTGAVDLTITGGTSPFGISWTGPNGFTSTAEDISGLNEGYYAVTVSDSKGCHATANITIMQPRPLYAAVDRTNVTCYGADDGTITISGSDGGSGFYEYSIDGGIAWSNDVTYTGLAPGTYVVMIRDLVNPTCMLTLNPGLQITGPPILSGTVGKTDITCHGSHDGTITISNPAGGYGTYQYSHNGGTDWQDSPLFTNLSAGSYSMVIRDRANPLCRMDLGPVVINEPDALAATVNSTDATCFGANNGTITISGATGGYGVYEYSINGGASWQASNTFPNLAPGTYNVRMHDRANPACMIIINSSLVITEPAILSATVARTNVTCNGANDGTITITNPLGGYGTYEYTVDGGSVWQSSGTFTGLAPGYYNVKIRDAANVTCEITLRPALQITEPAVLSASVASVNVTCNGADDGRITITNPLGGSGSYEYTVHGGPPWQPSGIFNGLAPGTYDVRIRDAANPLCVTTLNGTLVITEPLPLDATLTSTMISCFGANNGIIAISNPEGGSGTYEYTVNGGTNWSNSGNFTGLTPGIYNVIMRDAVHKTCEHVLNSALVITQPAVLAANVAYTNVTCFGGADGTITITNPTGGYGTYQYTVNGGGSWQSSGSFTGLGQGTYNVQIRDEAHPGCVIVLNNALVITQPAILRATITTTMVTCFGANNGIITITNPLGGSGSYEFSNDGGTHWQASGIFAGLAPGSYEVRIRDAANPLCEIVLNPGVSVTEPAELNAVVTVVNITCSGANNGGILISNPTGGYGTYDYSIDGGIGWQATGTFTGLSPATYDVRIRDRANPLCVVTLPAATITQPDPLSAAIVSDNITCNGANDGRIEISGAAGGSGAYQYSITGGSAWQSSGIFNYLSPGTYNVRLRDAANITCEITLDDALVITQPARLTAVVSSSNVTCNGGNDGSITITSPAGGYNIYEYSIDGGISWDGITSFTGLAPGFYNVQMRDAAHPACVVTLNGSVRITEPPVLSASVTQTNLTCHGAGDGIITISSPAGGHGAYEYTVTGGTPWRTTGTFSNLGPGSYDVRIRDAVNQTCEIPLGTLTITEPAALTATVTSVDISCFGANDGSISVTSPSGGYGTYQYNLNGSTSWQVSGNFTNLAPDTYVVRMRDAANPACEITLTPDPVISEPGILAATINGTNVSCFGGGDGSITINNATGGSGNYEYSINGGGSWNATGIFTNLIAGAYNILIRDASHPACIIVLNNAYLITQPSLLSATVSKTEVSCHGFNDGTISITSPAGGYGTYEYSIDGGLSWHASGFFDHLTPGTYDVRMRDEAHHGCAVILYPNLLITEPIRLSLSTTGDVVLNCFGDNNGMGTFYASGGTMPYTFIVDNQAGATVAGPGFNSQTFFSASAGVVNVTVVDANGCSESASIQITQPDELLPGSIGDDQIVCSGDIPAAIRELTPATGGPGARVFQWQSSTSVTGPFVNIAGANGSDYTPTTGATYTQYYRRMVTSGTCMPVYSNVVEVLVNPRPIAFLTGGGTICPGENAVIRITMPAGTGPFTVVIDGLGTINNYNSGDDITVSPAATTTYRLVSVIDANNCEVVAPSPSLSGTATVIVGDLPVITPFTPPDPVCEFSLASFRVTATGTNLTYQWYVDEGSGSGSNFVPVSDGGTYFGSMTPTLQIFNTVRSMNGFTYHLAVTGCGTTVTSSDIVLTVNTAPEITLHPRDITVCLGQDAVLEADATGTGITWQWLVNRGSGFVPVTDDSNFSGSQSNILTITDARSSFNGWIFRAVADGVCGVPVNTNFAVLRVINPPEVTTHPNPVAVCEDSPASFLGNGSGYTTMQWQVNTGGGWTDLSDGTDYIGTGTQQLVILNTPVAMNGNRYRLALVTSCAVVYTNPATLTVNANPVVDFSGISPMNACGGDPVTLDGNPTGGSGSYTQHRWTGDVGPLNNYFVQSPVFRPFISGTYDLNYRVTDSNGCTADDDLRIIVDSPSAQFSYDVPSGCSPLTVRFTKDMTGIDEWWWDFDDGTPVESTEASPVHVFINNTPGAIRYYNVTLRVRSAGNCFAEYKATITAYPAVDATFTPDNSVICSGSSITFTAATGAYRYFWDYGDGSSGYGTHSARHSYTNTGTTPEVHTVTLTTYTLNNCTDVQTYDITVMPVPVPQFTADPWTQVFKTTGNPVIFTNTTNAGTWNWLWRFGDGTTSTEMNPHHNYTQIGDYNVTLIAGNASCTDSVKHSVSVLPPAPVADFDSIPSGCAPLFVNISNTSLNTDLPGTTYHWDFGDGSTSTAKNPTYTYFTPGSYTVRLYVVGPGGTSDYSQAVHAHPSPKAYFEITPPQVYANDKNVRCFNLSQGGSTYLWDFGDGETSTEAEPVHKYMKEGVYDISLTVTSANGCTDQYILSPAVTVLPVGELRYPTVFIPNKTGPIERSDLPTGGLETDQFFYPPIRQLVLDYKLQIFNRWGVLIFETHDINTPWNGYYKGELCPQGVYVWLVEGKFADGKPYKKAGNITLLH
ncbi:MAG TPA: PKD domain-containing protein [Bacteroidales bacterium]|nr:PKD domain-containing protein [Bacteroidales bacterium]